MAVLVESPWRSIREVVIQSVTAYHAQQQQRKRKSLSWSSADGSGGSAVGDDGDIGFWEEEEEGTLELAQIGAERTKNVLILMSDTGGGHRASAEAIRDAFRIEFGDEYRVFVKDLFMEHAGWPLNDMERSCKFMVKHVQLWKVAFHSTSPRWVHNLYLAAIAAFHAKKMEAGLKKYKPDIIISVHPLMQHIPLWVLKWQNLQKRVIFATVITDLDTCHPTWFHTGVNRCYCPSEEVSKRASADGLEPSRIRVFGLPIRPSFCRAVLVKDELRKELEMDPQLPAVLLMGGGEGMGPVKKTAKALGESLLDKELGKPIGQLVVICGRNQTLSSTLRAIQWKIPVKIKGFVTQTEKWMGACDCIITKEVGNVPYVVDNGAGVFSKSSKQTASLVARWFGPESEELKKMSQNALKLAQPDAVFDIVRDIHELAERQGRLSRISDSLTPFFLHQCDMPPSLHHLLTVQLLLTFFGLESGFIFPWRVCNSYPSIHFYTVNIFVKMSSLSV